MQVLCCPDSFKESLSAPTAAAAMARGVQRAGHEARTCPIADGGEGTLALLVDALNGQRITVSTFDPLGRPLDAEVGLIPSRRLGIVEMAAASGLGQLSTDERNPMRTSSYGTGLLLAVAARNVDRLLLTLGGTATVDGGCGLVQALGTRMLTDYGQPIEDPMTGGMLPKLTRIEAVTGLPPMDLAVDVMVPLFGPTGAARGFASQKGADQRAIDLLEAGLMRLADLIDPDGVYRQVAGGGAAGGAAFTLHTLLGAEIHPGASLVLDVLDFEPKLAGIDVVLVGEGCLDGQTLQGKAPFAAAQRARDRVALIIGVCGQRGDGWEMLGRDRGGPLDRIISLTDHFPLATARAEPERCLEAVVHAELSQLTRPSGSD